MSLLRWGFKRQHGCDRGANKHYCITVMTTVTTYNVSKQHFIYLKFTQCYKTNRSIKTTKIFKRHTHTKKKNPAVCLLALSRSLALGEGKPCHEEPYIKKWCGKKRKPPIYSYMCAIGAGAPTPVRSTETIAPAELADWTLMRDTELGCYLTLRSH